MILGDRMKKLKNGFLKIIREEYKFLLFLFLLYFILQIPLNYYIITGGGISDVSSRIEVEEKYKGKGSFNISYVTELQKANLIGYLLSYLIPTWEREDADLYKYTTNESLEDIQFRSELDLKAANSTAIYWAYTLAEREVEESSSNLYVISTSDMENPFKVGDEILSIDGKSYETVSEYSNYLQKKEEGDTVVVKVLRNNKEKDLSATLYSYEDRLILGVTLEFVRNYETNPKVNIQFKKTESGPSGGLITTLEIYNQLTKKDLTHGLKIAGTGTIEEDGSIGQIGGIEHKLLGAADAKADIFLCPSGKNCEDALQYKKEKKLKIKILEVKTIEDAILQLEELA